jgi:hypothetical protein
MYRRNADRSASCEGGGGLLSRIAWYRSPSRLMKSSSHESKDSYLIRGTDAVIYSITRPLAH